MSNQHHSSCLSYTIKEINSLFCYLDIIIPQALVDTIYQQISKAQQQRISTYGFSKGATPLSYIQEHYKSNILEHVSEFIFKFFIINYLYEIVHQNKLPISSEPRLYEIFLEPNQDGLFSFELSLAELIEFKEWKHFIFKAPKRKNYKDIDRQVISFIKEEQKNAKKCASDYIKTGDWVGFSIQLLDEQHQSLFNDTIQKEVWLKIGTEEADRPFQELFLDKKMGDRFVTQAACLQEYFSHQIDTNYAFCITINEIVPTSHFSFDHFKHHFRLKTQKDIHHKLIEIFSYRNDLSQRRNMVEEALKLMISKHHIDSPNYLILRQQKIVLEDVQNNPDYQVYKTQQNFKETVRLLATKQVAEMLLIDQLAHRENIDVDDNDIKGYLNLMQRPRTKEFIYFTPPPTKIEGQEMPLPASLLKQTCLREKTLNHLIFHLTRK